MFYTRVFLSIFALLAALQPINCAPAILQLHQDNLNTELSTPTNTNTHNHPALVKAQHEVPHANTNTKRTPAPINPIPKGLIHGSDIASVARQSIKEMKKDAHEQVFPIRNPWQLPAEMERPRSPLQRGGDGERRNSGFESEYGHGMTGHSGYYNLYDLDRLGGRGVQT